MPHIFFFFFLEKRGQVFKVVWEIEKAKIERRSIKNNIINYIIVAKKPKSYNLPAVNNKNNKDTFENKQSI